MSLDPYGECVCASGKKAKWCCFKAYPAWEKAIGYLSSKQEQLALAAIEKLPEQGMSSAYVETLKAMAFYQLGKVEEAQKQIDHAMDTFPDYGYACDVSAILLAEAGNIPEAIEEWEEAIRLYPSEATNRLAEAYANLAYSHELMRHYLASWAHSHRALKLNPTNEDLQQVIDRYSEAVYFPASVRKHQLTFLSPDPLAVFNDDRRKRWDDAIQSANQTTFGGLIEIFERLSDEDPTDKSAWYNLALSHAWKGNTFEAIEAMNQYLKLEEDFELSAQASEINEFIRLSYDAGDESIAYRWVATYGEENAPKIFQEIFNMKFIRVAATPERGIEAVYICERPLDQPQDQYSISTGLNRTIGMFYPIEGGLSIESTSEDRLKQAVDLVKKNLKEPADHWHISRMPASIEYLDREPIFSVMNAENVKPEDVAKLAEQYFEEDWIKHTIPSLDGLTPLAASISEKHKARLEGVIRFRERAFGLYQTGYDFARLRNKLGLEKIAPKQLFNQQNNDISTYSIQELMKLNPADLNDDDLLAAYRAAMSLEAPKTAVRFAEKLVQRPAVKDRIDLVKVYSRMLEEKMDENLKIDVVAELANISQLDQQHYDGEHAGDLALLKMRCELADGQLDAATNTCKELIAQPAGKLELVATAIERMLSAGAYKSVVEVANLAMEQAQRTRNRDLQEQFREYLSVAKARA